MRNSFLDGFLAWDGGEKAAFSKVYSQSPGITEFSTDNFEQGFLESLWHFSCAWRAPWSDHPGNKHSFKHNQHNLTKFGLIFPHLSCSGRLGPPCHVCQTCEGSAFRWILSHGRNPSWQKFGEKQISYSVRTTQTWRWPSMWYMDALGVL